MTKGLEELLGLGKFSNKRSVPGTILNKDREYWYIEDDGSNDFTSLFHKVIGMIDPPIPTEGGAITGGCTLYLPDGRKFHAMSYKGDLKGWRKQIVQGAKKLTLLAVQLSDGELVISKKERIPLSECEVHFL